MEPELALMAPLAAGADQSQLGNKNPTARVMGFGDAYAPFYQYGFPRIGIELEDAGFLTAVAVLGPDDDGSVRLAPWQ